MRIFVSVLGVITFIIIGFGLFLAMAFSGRIFVNVPIIVLLTSSIIGMVGMFKNIKLGGAFWWFAALGIAVPALYWVYTIIPGSGNWNF